MATYDVRSTSAVPVRRRPRTGTQADRVRQHTIAISLLAAGDTDDDATLDDLARHLDALDHDWPSPFFVTREEFTHLLLGAEPELTPHIIPATYATVIEAAQWLADLTGIDLTVISVGGRHTITLA